MRKKITILFILISFCVFSQNKAVNIIPNRSYTTLKSYKNQFGNNFTKNDSLNFIIRDKDTLVPFPKDYIAPRGVLVSYEEKDSTFLEVYKDIVYKKYHKQGEVNSSKLKMRHWETTLKIYFANSVDRSVKKELKSFARYLSNEVDSLTITFVNNLEKSNYIIYGYDSAKDYKYDTRIKSNNNDYYLSWRRNRLYNCKLQINSNSYKNKKDLVLKSKKLFLKTLGHFNTTKLLPKDNYFSSFNSKNKQFTLKDLEILKYHYSYGICKGTTLKTFERQHKDAKRTLKLTGKNMRFLHSD